MRSGFFMSSFSRITGTGSYLPPKRLSNADMVARLAQDGIETSDEWILERSGISARHFADEGVFCSDLALHACQAALQAAGRSAQDVDLIIVATSTPDMVFPSTACILQGKLGAIGGAALDVQAVGALRSHLLRQVDGGEAAKELSAALQDDQVLCHPQSFRPRCRLDRPFDVACLAVDCDQQDQCQW